MSQSIVLVGHLVLGVGLLISLSVGEGGPSLGTSQRQGRLHIVPIPSAHSCGKNICELREMGNHTSKVPLCLTFHSLLSFLNTAKLPRTLPTTLPKPSQTPLS